MTSGELARQAGVTLRTVRFYEEKGLLKPSAASPGGKRVYDDADATAIMQKVRLLKEAGMTLEEILNTVQLLSGKETQHKARQQAHAAVLAEARIKITRRIRELGQLQEALDRALANEDSCGACGAADCRGCSVLDTWTRFGLEQTTKEERI